MRPLHIKETAAINAEKAKIQAQGQADAKKIAAEAEAKANKAIAASLTPELIEKQKIEKSTNSFLAQILKDSYNETFAEIIKMDSRLHPLLNQQYSQGIVAKYIPYVAQNYQNYLPG